MNFQSDQPDKRDRPDGPAFVGRARTEMDQADPEKVGVPVVLPINPSKLSLSFGGVPMVGKGIGHGFATEAHIAKVFREKEFTITVGLGQGHHQAHIWMTDLSFGYIRINASYRS